MRVGHTAEVGEVHAYQSAMTGQRVLHRVINTADDRFIFKGDNNSWIDSTQPTGSELIGKLWFRVPRAGRLLEWLRAPFHAALIAGGLAAMVAHQAAQPAKAKGPTGRARRPEDSAWTSVLLTAAGNGGQTILGLLVGLTLIGGAIAATAWHLDADNEISVPQPYNHTGRFEYAAETVVPPASAPDGPQSGADEVTLLQQIAENPSASALLLVPVTTGQPIFVNVNPFVDFHFHYVLETAAQSAVSGTVRLDAVLSDVTGWSRTFEFAPEQRFTGTSVDLDVVGTTLEDLMAAFPIYEAVTGHAPRHYTASLVAVVEVDGTLDGHQVHETFRPELTFRVVPPFEIFVETEETRQFEAGGVAAPQRSAETPFRFEQSGTVPGSRIEANSVPVLGMDLDIRGVRAASLAVVTATLLGIVAIVVMQWRAARRGEAFLLRARHGGQFVFIESGDTSRDGSTIDVPTVDDLMRLARYHNSPILVPIGGDQNLYLVRGGDRLYAYEAPE